MLRPGRRRSAALSPFPALCVLLCLFISTASAASSVLGIDFGTLNFKAALVKPGIPFEIVLSKDSKRKETAAVAFKPTRDSQNNVVAEANSFPERAYGGDALALQGRFPSEVFPNLKPLLGLPWAEGASGAVETYKERYPAVQAVQVQEMGTTTIKSQAFAEGEMPWSVEELLAMELANIKKNAETLAGPGSSVGDAVITVPVFYTADERRAIQKAAELAGLNVNSLISDGLAVGMEYAKSRTFPEVTAGGKPEHHMVFDMGAGSTTATLLRFQGRSVKDVGRFNKTVQEVTVLGTGWDRTLGGDSLNHAILDDYVHKFLTKPVMKSRGTQADEVKRNGRAMSRLWKEVEKARQVLSANTETSSSFEELLPDIDFRVKLTRSDFEKLASSFSDRVAGPINDALAAAKMTMAEVDSIILHGGAVRTPFVQKKLEEIAGGSAKLRSNVNSDEAAVFGAAFKGAGLSPSFKVKEIRDSDVAGYAAGITFEDSGKDRRQGLFSAISPIGHGAATKSVSFKDKDDFAFEVYQVVNDVDRAVNRIQTENLTASVKELQSKFGCEKEDISTKFAIRLSAIDGLPEVVGGSVSCEVEDSPKSGSVGDSVKDWLGFGKKKEQEPLGDVEDDGPVEEVEAASSASTFESATSTSSSASSSTSKPPEKPKKRTESISIKLVTLSQGNPQPGPEEVKRMKDRLTAFDRSDRARFAREEALNVLEGFTYYVRDFLDNKDFASVSTEQQRGEISKLLETTKEWMESSAAKATEDMLRDKLSALKKLVTPIQARRKEETSRPEKLSVLRDSLEQTQKLMEMVKEQVEKASAMQSKASVVEAAKSAAETDESTTTTSPVAVDDFADLEEPDTAADSTTEAPPAYSKPSDFTQYTNADLTDVSQVYESVSQWLDEKEAAQKKLSPSDEPVLLIKDIEAEAAKLGAVMSDLLYKKMKAPKSTSSKKAKSTKTKSTKNAKSSTTGAPDMDDSADAAAPPRFLTVNSDDEMPSEEEILSMVKEAQSKADSSDGDTRIRDEL